MTDRKKLLELIKVSRSIETIYHNLYECEVHNNKEEFVRQLDYLSIAISVEDDVYKKIDFNHENISALIEHIKSDFMSPRYKSNLECLITSDNQDFVIRRILTKLSIILANNTNSSKYLTTYLNKVGVLENNSIEYIKDSTKIIFLINTNCLIKNYNSLLTFRDINGIDNYITKLKYNIAMIDYRIEDQLLNNNFDNNELKPIYYIISNVMNSYKLNQFDYIRIVNKYYKKHLKDLTPEASKTNDEKNLFELSFRTFIMTNYSKELSKIDSETRQKAGFKITKEGIEDIKKYEENFIDDVENKRKTKRKKDDSNEQI